MKSDQTWIHIHAERAAMADTWTELSVDQWTSPSWCDGWSVQDAAGHILAAAEQTPFNFYKKQMAAAGFRFNVFADRAAKRLGRLSSRELVDQLRRADHEPSTGPRHRHSGRDRGPWRGHPPPPGFGHPYAEGALVAAAYNCTKTNLLIGSKRRIVGLRLRASDCDWVHGDGLVVSGPWRL